MKNDRMYVRREDVAGGDGSKARAAAANRGALFSTLGSPSHQKLLGAALHSFAHRGYRATTTRDIAKRAGMSPAALYIHYGSKTEILFAIVKAAHGSLQAQLQAGSYSPDDPIASLESFVGTHVSFHATHHTAARVANYELNALPPAQRKEIIGIRHQIEQMMRNIIEAGMRTGQFHVDDAELTSVAILSLGIDVARWYSPKGRLGPADLARLYTALVLKLVAGTAVIAGPNGGHRDHFSFSR